MIKREITVFRSRFGGRILLIAIFLLLIHGAKFSSPIIGIDTEDIIRLQDGFYGGWLQSGRYGLIWLKKLLGTYSFNPYFANHMTLVFLFTGVTAYFLLWDKTAGWRQKKTAGTAAWITGSFLWISHPILTEQLYFSLQSLEICVGMCLTAIALYGSCKGLERGYRWLWGFSAALLTMVFGIYQVFVVIYIFGAVSLLLLHALRQLAEQKMSVYTWKQMLWEIFSYAGIFLSAFLLNSFLARRLTPYGSAYLSGQIHWGTIPIKENLLRILDHGFKAVTGTHSIYYHPIFGLLSVFSVCLLLVYCKRMQIRRCETIWCLLLLFALLSTPFWMTFLCGGAPVIRSQLVLPAVTGFLAYFCINIATVQPSIKLQFGCTPQQSHQMALRSIWFSRSHMAELLLNITGCCIKSGEENADLTNCSIQYQAAGRKGTALVVLSIIALCIPAVWSQSQVTLGLYYTEECRYSQDVALGRSVMFYVEKAAGTDSIAVVFVGSHPFGPSHACISGETMGHSFFDYDVCVEPECYWSSRRAVGFLHTLGYQVSHASVEDTKKAVEFSKKMPVWPADGSVCLINGIVIVKLSEIADAVASIS